MERLNRCSPSRRNPFQRGGSSISRYIGIVWPQIIHTDRRKWNQFRYRKPLLFPPILHSMQYFSSLLSSLHLLTALNLNLDPVIKHRSKLHGKEDTPIFTRVLLSKPRRILARIQTIPNVSSILAKISIISRRESSALINNYVRIIFSALKPFLGGMLIPERGLIRSGTKV